MHPDPPETPDVPVGVPGDPRLDAPPEAQLGAVPDAPPVYARRPVPARLSPGARLYAALVAAGALTVLLVAIWLKPDAAGIGSHRQLGLDRCQFEARTGLPCPTCGMTTSFAHFVRGHFLASLYVQPMGTALALATALTFWGAAYVAFTARPAHRLLQALPTRYYLVPLFAGLVAGWAWKIVIHVRGFDGWG